MHCQQLPHAHRIFPMSATERSPVLMDESNSAANVDQAYGATAEQDIAPVIHTDQQEQANDDVEAKPETASEEPAGRRFDFTMRI